MKTSQIILIIIVIILGFYLFNNYFSNKTEHMTDIPDEINKLLEESSEVTYYSDESNTNGTNTTLPELSEEDLINSATSVDNDTLPLDSVTSVTNIESEHNHVFPKTCTVKKTSNDVDKYVRNLVLNGQKYCSNNKNADNSVIKNYREDFFNFRDKIWDNSKQNDLSYKVARLYLEGNTKLTDRVKGRKVADIYDELSRHQPIRDKNCINKSTFDHTLHQGYYNTQGSGETQLTRDNWMYINDNKVVDSGLSGYDPNGNLESLVEVGQQYQLNN